MIGYFLVGGAINAVILSIIAFLLSRFAGDIYGRSVLVIFLFIAVWVYGTERARKRSSECFANLDLLLGVDSGNSVGIWRA